MFRPLWRSMCAQVMTTAMVAAAISPAFGEDGGTLEIFPTASIAPPLPAHRFVVRISDAMLASYLGSEIEQRVPVNDVILGTAVTGTAHISGEPCVKLLEQTEGAAFHVEFRGTAVSRTVGRNGPAIIHSRSVTHFVATKQIVYETDRGFTGQPAQVSARTQCFTEGIDSTRRGLIGRVVRRKAAEQVAESKSLTTEIARQKAQRQIAAAFERRMGERIAHLNRLAESQSLWAGLVGGSGRLPYACGSTTGHLNIAASHHQPQPICLPVRGSASETAAPVELWIHDSLVPSAPPRLRKLIDQISAASDVVSAVSSPAALIKKQAIQAAAAGLSSKVACQTIHDWVVVELVPFDSEPIARTALAPTELR